MDEPVAYVDVLRPGLLTTVQDLGRRPYQRYGVAVSGAMDPLALRLGNILVGNEEGAAGLEVTLVGPTLRFGAPRIIAVTGGDLEPALNGAPIPLWQTVAVGEGDVLTFRGCRSGCRAYVAVAGGIDVPTVMGSRSTFMRGGYGGFEGRALQAGDRLPLGKPRVPVRRLLGRRLPGRTIPDYRTARPVRFIPGPQDDAFTPEALETFTTCAYTVSTHSDRMGYRLEGPTLKHRAGADIISDYIPVGAIQVPGNGQPIVLMADCQMTGGYTKIGVVIGVDIPYMAQRKPGDAVTFQPVTVEEAIARWRFQEVWIARLRTHNAAPSA